MEKLKALNSNNFFENFWGSKNEIIAYSIARLLLKLAEDIEFFKIEYKLNENLKYFHLRNPISTKFREILKLL